MLYLGKKKQTKKYTNKDWKHFFPAMLLCKINLLHAFRLAPPSVFSRWLFQNLKKRSSRYCLFLSSCFLSLPGSLWEFVSKGHGLILNSSSCGISGQRPTQTPVNGRAGGHKLKPCLTLLACCMVILTESWQGGRLESPKLLCFKRQLENRNYLQLYQRGPEFISKD